MSSETGDFSSLILLVSIIGDPGIANDAKERLSDTCFLWFCLKRNFPETTTPVFTECPQHGLALGVGKTCGLGNKTCGFCSFPRSACGATPSNARERVCLCVSNTVEVEDRRGARSCVKPPIQLFDDTVIPDTVLLPSHSKGGDAVLSITLLTLSKARFTKTLQIFPQNSFLVIDDSKFDDSHLILFLVRLPPNANAKHEFTVTATVNYIDDDIIVTDVLHLTINTTHVFQPTPPVRSVFVVDGTRAGAVVFDLLSVLGNVDGLSLTLETDIPTNPFGIEGNLVVCEIDIHLKHFVSIGHIGRTVTVRIKNSGQIGLVLKVAIIASRFQRPVAETDDYSFKVVDFRYLVKDFEVSLISTGAAGNFFSISDSQDHVHLTQILDYETVSQKKFSFDLVIRSREGTRARSRARDAAAISTTITADIEVHDVDDTAPKSEQAVYNFVLHQGADYGTIIGFLEFTDPDTSLDKLVYTIVDVGNTVKHLFRQIDPANRGLILKQKLPRVYSNTTIEFNVTASDGISSSEPVKVLVKVYKFYLDIETVTNPNVQDVNLNEEGATGQVVTSLAIVNYTGYSLQAPSSFFGVDKITGEVMTTAVIDRESLLENPLTVSVTAYPEDESCIFRVVGNASVTIVDINDNRPKFIPSDVYSVTILEHSDVNTSVVMVSAVDDDIGTNADLTFSLSGPDSSLFAIDSTTGLVTVQDSQGLDREVNTTRHVTIDVTDGVHQVSATLTVTLTDINDNDPAFSSGSYTLTILENEDPGMDHITLNASDPDADENGEIRFQLWQGGLGLFTVNSSTGVLSTTQPLDREQIDSFNLTVLAFDDGSPPRSASTTVFITVADLNDVTPHFETGTYFETLDEGAGCITTPIFSLSAQDDDAGANGQIIYSIDNGPLWINSSTGQIFCRAGLDYETQKLVTSIVTVEDKGTPALNSTATVYVTLRDVNDDTPTFLGTPFNFTVDIQDSFVGIVYAEDRDSGANGNVTYSVRSLTPSGQGLLTVTSQGLLFLTNISKVVTVGQSYRFTLTATDGGSPPLNSNTEVTVNFLSTSSASLFTNPEFSFTMVENANYSLSAIGQLVPAVGSVTFALEAVFPHNTSQFRVDSATGEVFCDTAVDREQYSLVDFSFLLYVKGLSSAGTPDYAVVRVSVLDVNDNPPIFLRTPLSYEASLLEGTYNATIVMNITAVDPDYGINGTVVFSANDSSAPFKINPANGSITVNGELDRETVPEYILIITIRDSGPVPKSASLMWTAVIRDVNDNPPEFDMTYPIIFTVPENASVTYLVGTMYATDKDLPLNGHIYYSVVNPNSCPCDIGSSGELRPKQNWTLDYDDETTREYICVVKAENIFTSVALFSETNVTIRLTDVNDNAPVFLVSTLNITVPRDVKVNDVIVEHLNATDADSGQNKALTYSIGTSGLQSNSSFSISPLYGTLVVRRSLRNVLVEMITLNVTVTDLGNPPLSDSMLVHIRITDTNTSPQFTKTTYNFSISEELNPNNAGPVLLTVSAIDFEEGKQDRCNCSYSITKDNSGKGAKLHEYFQVNSKSGEVTLIKTIDREVTGDMMQGHVIAVDSGIPPKTSSALLRVTVLDTNDNGPKFSKSDFAITVNESICKPGTVFYTLMAFDEDSPPNDQFQYSIRQSDILNGSKYVDVSKTSGELSSKSSNICSKASIFLFKAAVTEVVNNMLTNRADEILVKVTLMMTNNAPVFSKATYNADLPFSSEKGTTLTVPGFSASDADNDTIVFDLQRGNRRDLFRINSQTGTLILQYQLDDTIPSPLNLTIIATDRGDVSPQFAKTGTTAVVVFIGDLTLQTCFPSDEASDLITRADQFNIYRVLFIILVILLVVAILVSVIFIYKWRILKMEREDEMSDTGSTRPLHSMFQPPVPAGSGEERSNTRLGDPSGLPPGLPRRLAKQSADTGQSDLTSADSGLDSAGYLAPSTSAEYASDQNISYPKELPTPHQFPRRQQGNNYLSLIPSDTEQGILGRKQSDTYLHPTAEAQQPPSSPEVDTYLQLIRGPDDPYPSAALIPTDTEQGILGRKQSDTYLHPTAETQQPPSSPEVDTYLQLIRGPDDPYPSAAGESDPYHHPTGVREVSTDHSYSLLSPGAPSNQSDTDSYLHPTAETQQPPSSPEVDTYLQLIRGPDDPYPSAAGESDPYHHPTGVREVSTDHSYSLLSPGAPSNQSDTDSYLHPTAETQQPPSSPEVDTYLQLIRGPDDPYPSAAGESDPYHHPTGLREVSTDHSYSLLSPGAPSNQSDTDSYLHPIAGPADVDLGLRPPSPHSSYVSMSSSSYNRDPAVYISGMSRSLGHGAKERDFSGNIPTRYSVTALGHGMTWYNF